MTDASSPSAGAETGSVAASVPSVRVLVVPVDGADVDAALASIRRQAYDGSIGISVVGGHEADGDDFDSAESLEEAVSGAESSYDYLWILHADARPRPDALSSLVREVERNDAGLGASKLLQAGTRDVLESIGSATDVFGEPYTGLEEDEIDLQQYDVVREVSFVTSVSMLVRRDLAKGLGGLDRLLPPDAAGLDFSQRARIAGARVIIVPSSEVYHQGRCRAQEGWRERAGRLRAMLVAYGPLTLAWVVPLAFVVGLLDSILNLLLLRWNHLGGFLATWLWNLLHLPSTFMARRRARSIRSVGDEELFRFQTSGSVRLRTVGDEISARVLSMFDEDQAITRGAKKVWSSPGIWGAALAVVVVAIAARTLIFTGMPNSGMNFEFEPPSIALARYLGGWNDAGLGSPVPVHPSVAFAGVSSLVWFGAEGAARLLLTIGAGVVAVVGMGRLLGRLGLRGPGRYLAGIVAIAGPGTAVLTGVGSWTALMGGALLPWAIRAVFVHPAEHGRSRLSTFGWALILGWAVAAISPVLAVVPAVAALLWAAQGGRRSRILLALASLGGSLAAANFVVGDPTWLLDAGRRIGLTVDPLWPGLVLVAALPLFLDEARHRRATGLGAILSLASLVAAATGLGGPGIEEATLVTASVGAAVVVGVALDRVRLEVVPLVSTIAALAMIVLSMGSIFNGTLGLERGDVNDDLSFAETLVEDDAPRRILYVSADKTSIPGEARPGPGFWYRVLEGSGTTIDETWLPPARLGDVALASVLDRVAGGSALRPGMLLSEFGVGWVVVAGEPSNLDTALQSQLDVVPLPFDTENRIFENPGSEPVARTAVGEAWVADGTGWAGEPSLDRVELAINHTSGWQPQGESLDWYTTIEGSDGEASYDGHQVNVMLGWLGLAALAAGLVLVAVGRSK